MNAHQIANLLLQLPEDTIVVYPTSNNNNSGSTFTPISNITACPTISHLDKVKQDEITKLGWVPSTYAYINIEC